MSSVDLKINLSHRRKKPVTSESPLSTVIATIHFPNGADNEIYELPFDGSNIASGKVPIEQRIPFSGNLRDVLDKVNAIMSASRKSMAIRRRA
ncbi:MAG TPA: hypothetical protein VEB01_03910 [Methylocaldum sp.]|nr:hypothetical protein [Methylocaldum sp.]